MSSKVRTGHVRDDSQLSLLTLLRYSMQIYFVFLRYCAGSILTLIIDNLVFAVVYARTGSIGWGIVLARLVAMFASFYFSREAVFRFRGRAAPAFLRFVGLVTLLGAVSYLGTSFLAETAQMRPGFAKLIVEGVLFFASFGLNRLFVFSASAKQAQIRTEA